MTTAEICLKRTLPTFNDDDDSVAEKKGELTVLPLPGPQAGG